MICSLISTTRRSRILVLAIIIIGASPALANRPFPVRSIKVNQISRVAMHDIAAFYGLSQTVRDKNVYWQGPRNRAEFRIDRRQATINGIKVHLSHAIALYQEQPVLGEIDFRLLIDPILRNAALPRRPVQTVFIDPGHGGKDPGAIGRNHQEKTLALQISRHLARILQQQGFNVRMTRNSDTFISLSQRVEIANAGNADLFVSIHLNSAENKSVQGIETFLLSPRGAAETYSNYPTTRLNAGNQFDKQNLRLAYEIQYHTIRRSNANDRGIKHADFQVLRNLECPGVLIETGFISNLQEEAKLGNQQYQLQIARGIAEGIVAYRNALAHP